MKSLIIVDYQNDFISGSLQVPGAKGDLEHLTNLVRNKGVEFENIFCVQDLHPANHISFTTSFVDMRGNMPSMGTKIIPLNMKDFIPVNGISEWYYEEYIIRNRSLTLWEPHCINGSNGASYPDKLHKSLMLHRNSCRFFFKGHDKRLESFGAFYDCRGNKSELCKAIVSSEKSHKFVIVGLASNICKLETAKQFGAISSFKKLIWLEESNYIPEYNDKEYANIINAMHKKGMEVTDYNEYE